MKINTRDRPLKHKPPVPLEIETCPLCLQDLEQNYSMPSQLFRFECTYCRCKDKDISRYKVLFWYGEHEGQEHKWFQEFSIGGVYIKTDLQTMISKLFIRGPIIENEMDIDFVTFGLDNREVVVKKFSIYSTFS